MRVLKNSLLSVLFLVGLPALAQDPQTPIPVSQVDPWILALGEPASVSLVPHGPGARNGGVWIGNTGHSIRIIGEVDGAAPDWPKDKNSILSKDHVEVWLAGPADVEMSPLSWGGGAVSGWRGPNNVGATTEDDCQNVTATPADSDGKSAAQECRGWFEKQRNYRPLFTRLFVRQWLLGQGVTVESFATPAYESLTRDYGLDLTAAKPNANVRFRVEARAGGTGYRFEIDIPYSAFPPLNLTQISKLRLMVDVFSAAPVGKKEGAFSTTSSARIYGRPETFNVLHLEPPLLFEVSPCHSELRGKVQSFSPEYPAWFVPPETPGEYAAATFLVEDWAGPMAFWTARPAELSPIISPFHFFWRALGPSEYVCGPDLAYGSGEITRNLGENLTLYDAGRGADVSQDGFAARRDASGTILVKIGPRVWNAGSGTQCGACPRTELQILAIDKNSNLITLLSLGGTIGGLPVSNQDFTVSPDWSRVVEYDATQNDDGDDIWSSVTYCRGDPGYTVCDRKQDVKPPDPPVIRQLLEGQ